MARDEGELLCPLDPRSDAAVLGRRKVASFVKLSNEVYHLDKSIEREENPERRQRLITQANRIREKILRC